MQLSTVLPNTVPVMNRGADSRPHVPALTRYWSFLVVFTFCLVPFFLHLGYRELASSHEARAAQDAQTILTSGDWVLPRLFDGRAEMQKPPLYYWLVAICGWFNGGTVDAMCVRFPSAISAAACVLLLWLWGIRRGRPLAGMIAGVVLATSLHFTTLARIGRIDMPLTFCTAVTLVAFFEASEQRRHGRGRCWPWHLIGFLAIAAGVMLKGPIAVVLPVVVWIGHLLLLQLSELSAQARATKKPLFALRARLMPFYWGIPLILALTLPWYIWANWLTDGEFFRVFFWQHNIDRGFGTDETLRASPWWYYGPELLRGMLPWSILLPLGAHVACRKRQSSESGSIFDADARFGAMWLVAMLVLLSIMRFKRADYLLPAYPGAAWMLGCLLERQYLMSGSRRWLSVCGAISIVTAMVWLGYVSWIEPTLEESRTHRLFAQEVRRHAPGHVIFFRAEAHVIAFHVGPPIDPILEWENLDSWAGAPQSTYVVMPEECLNEWRDHLTRGLLDVVAHSEDMRLASSRSMWSKLRVDAPDNRERPYVLVRTKSLPGPTADWYTK